MKSDSIVVRYRTVSISIYPWSPRPGTIYYQFRHGSKKVTRSTLEKAKLEAKRIAELTYLGGATLSLTIPQTRAIRRMIEVDPSLSTVDAFIAWHARQYPTITIGHAVDTYLHERALATGRSQHGLRLQRLTLAKLPRDRITRDMTVDDLPPLTGAPRTVRNTLSLWQTFFRWCQSRNWFPLDSQLPTDRVPRPAVLPSSPDILTPNQLAILIAHVAPPYRAWLALQAWAGLRSEEICPSRDSQKDCIRWSDIGSDYIVVRPEVSKTGRRRLVPVLPPVRITLESVPCLDPAGRLGPHRPPHAQPEGGKKSETGRLGAFIGGWKANALRHSFISYRAALVGITQAANEAGNSETIARRHYAEAVTAGEADRWFNPSTFLVR